MRKEGQMAKRVTDEQNTLMPPMFDRMHAEIFIFWHIIVSASGPN